MFPNLENTYESGFGALRRHVVSHHSSFFPNIMKTFKHIAKSKEFCSPHSFSHHVDSTTNILVYLLYHSDPSTHLSVHLNFFWCISKWIADINVLPSKYLRMHINRVQYFIVFFSSEVILAYNKMHKS